jgi:hypothetical protein
MRDRPQPGAVHTPTRLAETPIPRATMPAFSPVRRSARVVARVVPFDPVAEALRPQSAHKVKKPEAFYIESVMEIRKTQYHEEFRGCGVGLCRQASQVVCGVGLRCGLAQALHPGLTGGVAVSHAWRDRYV